MCGSSDVQLLDIIIDLSRTEGTLPIWKCNACPTTFAGRSVELEHHYGSHGYNSSYQQLLKTIAGDGTDIDINSCTGKLRLNEEKIKEIINSHLNELYQKIDSLYEDSLLTLKTKINKFQLEE